MQKLLAAFTSLLFFSLASFSQSTKTSVPSTSELSSGAEEFIAKAWKSQLAKCGESLYFLREDKGKEVLFEARGIEYDKKQGAAEQRRNHYETILWSGNATVRFSSYRKMDLDSKMWSEWAAGGAESFFFAYEKGRGWVTAPSRVRETSCTKVASLKGEVGEGKLLPDNVLNAGLTSIDGQQLQLDRGLVVLYLWATWCGPCRLQDPEMVKIYDKYHEGGLTVIGLDADPEPGKEIKAYKERFGVNYLLAVGGDELSNSLMEVSRVRVIPQTLIIHNGKLIKIFKGFNPQKTPNDPATAIEAELAK